MADSQTILKELSAAVDKNGKISFAIVERVFCQHPPQDIKTLKGELKEMAKRFQDAALEAGEMAPGEKQTDIGNATLELEAAIKTTEEAANTILDAADVLQACVDDSPLAKDQKINDAIMEIITACNFQDLTGQRIRKVAKVLEYIEPRIERLIAALVDDIPVDQLPKKKSVLETAGTDEFDESELLNGPQLEEDAPSQEDIDALFDKS